MELVQILVFPGFLFLIVFGLAGEYVDRKFHAKLQNRIGPPWYQPFADLIKLSAKRELIPADVDRPMFMYTPIVALAATVTAFFYIPMWDSQAIFSFRWDVIVVLYLLTIPTMTFFLGGWYSRSMYSMIGAARTLMQLFAYEIPLFLSILAPALLANTWSLSEMTVFYNHHPWLTLVNIIGFGVSLVAFLGKLERVPFDIPEAETEIVAGAFTEYSGRLLALFRLTTDVEMMVGASLIAAVFLPFGLGFGPVLGFVFYLLKVLLVVAILTVLRTVMARLRIDQMLNFCWQIVAPVAFLQIMIDLLVKGWVNP